MGENLLKNQNDLPTDKLFSKYKYKKNYITFIILCYFYYILCMALKMVYSVEMVAIQDNFGVLKSEVALGLTIYYLVYAVAQITLAPFIKKINVERFLLITCILSAVSFSLIGFTSGLWQVWLIFGLNGIFQVATWGGFVLILSKYLPDDVFAFALKVIATGNPFGKVLCYGVSALFVAILSWKATFVFFGIIFLISIILMFSYTIKMKEIIRKNDENKYQLETKESIGYIIPEGKRFNVALLVAVILIIAVLSNIVSYGISNWIPNLLKEEHGLNPSFSMLFTMIVPFLTGFVSVYFYSLCDRKGKIFSRQIPIGIVLILFTVSMVFLYDWNLTFAIVSSVVISMLITAFSSSFGTYSASKLKNYINVGTTNLFVNAGASLGAAVVPYITGLIMDAYGWAQYYVFLSIILAVSFALTVGCVIIIKKKKTLAKWFC